MAYQRAVADAVDALADAGIGRPRSDSEWVRNPIPHSSSLANGGYFKHGVGCTVRLGKRVVNFDFGEEGQIDGFDPGRLWDFARQYTGSFGFSDSRELAACFEKSLSAGEIDRRGLILHYMASAH